MPVYKSNYEIGATLVGLTNLAALTTPVPYPKFSVENYTKPILLPDGRTRGAGWKTLTWSWAVLSQTERDMLKTFCTGASARIYIRSRYAGSLDAFGYYQVSVTWPKDEAPDFKYRTDFSLRFTNLISVTP